MVSLRNVLCGAAVAGLLFSSSNAEARFGKRSRDDKKGKVHDASAVGSESSSDDDDGSHSSSSSVSRTVDTLQGVLSLLELLPDPKPVRYQVVAELPPEPASTAQTVPPLSDDPSVTAEAVSTSSHAEHSGVRVGGEGGSMGSGTSVQFNLGLEGERMGVDLRGTRLSLPTDDGTAGTDDITLVNLHLTYALAARQNLRLRLEGGIAGAYAPDLSISAPSVALSLEACLLSALDGEARVQVIPFPYQQVDVQAGLALRFQALALRGGWRALYLNDNGLVNEVEHTDSLSGPYLGLGLSF